MPTTRRRSPGTTSMFTANPILPVSARYPGLEGATSALMSLTGMSSFGAGLIVIAAARLTLSLAMLVLFYWLCGSWRIASLGAAFYAGNSNFLLWSAQFSYESLSLPLLVVVLALIVQRAATGKADRHIWSIPTVIVIAAIVITHHLTSYLLDLVLILLVVAPRVSRGRLNNLRVGRFAVVSLVLTIGWLVVVASETVGYISPLVTNAVNEALKTIGGESAPRAPFASSSGAVPTPLLEKAVAFGALVLLFAALPFGLRAVWRRHKRDPVAVGFCLIALGYFAILVLRLEPDAWEIGNRLGEFLFIGLGFVVAYGVVDRSALPQHGALGSRGDLHCRLHRRRRRGDHRVATGQHPGVPGYGPGRWSPDRLGDARGREVGRASTQPGRGTLPPRPTGARSSSMAMPTCSPPRVPTWRTSFPRRRSPAGSSL